MKIIDCLKTTELPTTPLYNYGRVDVEQAAAAHQAKGRGQVEIAYVLRREVYIPVVRGEE